MKGILMKKTLTMLISLFLILTNLSPVFATDNLNPTSEDTINNEISQSSEASENTSQNSELNSDSSPQQSSQLVQNQTEQSNETTKSDDSASSDGLDSTKEDSNTLFKLNIKNTKESKPYEVIQLIKGKPSTNNSDIEDLTFSTGFIQNEKNPLTEKNFVENFEKVKNDKDMQDFINKHVKYFNIENKLNSTKDGTYEIEAGYYYIFSKDNYYTPLIVKIVQDSTIELTINNQIQDTTEKVKFTQEIDGIIIEVEFARCHVIFTFE
jgi:hypothetical protein